MATIVIALYSEANQAQQAANDLGKSGFRKEDIQVFKADGQAGDALTGKLSGWGISNQEARLYLEAIKQGNVVVALEAPDEKAENALDILNRYGAQPFEEIESKLRQSGQQQGREEARETVPVVEEQVSVGKRRVLRGGVRVTTTVTERPVEESVRLREESVELERQRADRKISPEEADKAFQQKTVEMTETAEEAVVNKEARVVEEVALRKTAQEHEETIHETARRTDVKVEDIQPKGQPQQKK